MLSGQHIFNVIYLRSWSQVSGSTSPHIAEKGFSILQHSTILFYAFKYPGVDGSDAQLEIFSLLRGRSWIQSASGSRAIPIPGTQRPVPSHCAGKFSWPGKQQLLFEHGSTDGFYCWTNPPIPFPAGQTDSWTEGRLQTPPHLATPI